MKKNDYDLLIAIIRAAFGQSVDELALSKEEICIIEEMASRQSILPVVICGLKNLGFSELLTDSMKDKLSRSTYDYIQRRESLKQIVSVLEEIGVDYIPLKGAVLRDLYPQPCMRTSSDIDVLVREKDVNATIEAIKEKTDFEFIKRAHHDVQFVNKRLLFELHFSLLTNLAKFDSVLGRAWENSYQVNDGGEFAFLPEFQVFYITAHAAKHLVKGGGIGIRPILDLWLLRTKTKYDENVVEALCDEAGILEYYKSCCQLLRVWFDCEPHTEVTRAFEKLILSGGVFGSKHNAIIAHTRNHSKSRYVINRVFMSSAYIKDHYPVCTKYPVLMPAFQVVRWTHLLNPAKRKAARLELKQARVIDPLEVKEYDELMKKIGL